MLETKKITYFDENISLEGYYAVDSTLADNKPIILVAHDWSGRNEFAEKKARELAQLGYVGFAIDMYGDGRYGNTKEEKAALIQPFIQDRALLRKRITAAYMAAQLIPGVNPSQIGAIGFCFGGLCVLDLARSGIDVKGVVSFHGLLMPADALEMNRIDAKILVQHGHEDPMVPLEQVAAFEDEMTQAQADWQVRIFSKTMHGFTNPLANDVISGIVYNKLSANRSWVGMIDFFKEIFR